MGMAGSGSPFGQYQAGGQQLAAAGVNAQLQNKAALANNLPTFSADLKGAAVPNVPNMVSPWWTLQFIRYVFCKIRFVVVGC